MATVICSDCGAAMPEGSRFCENCGARLPLAPVREAPEAAWTEEQPVSPYEKTVDLAACPELRRELDAVLEETTPQQPEAAPEAPAHAFVPVYEEEPASAPMYEEAPAPAPEAPVGDWPGRKSRYAPMTSWGMALQIILMGIPLLGQLLMIIWACGGCRKIARRNLARAYVILILLGILLTVAAALVLRFGFAEELTQIFEQLVPGYTIRWN